MTWILPSIVTVLTILYIPWRLSRGIWGEELGIVVLTVLVPNVVAWAIWLLCVLIF